MKLIIDIPKGTYEAVRVGTINQVLEYKVWNAIKDGVPLPEEHGRLIDADILIEGREDDYEFCEAVNATPTIIKADKRKRDE